MVAGASKRGGGRSAAVVLAGGGALGAYETGVLRYVLDAMRRDHGVEPSFEVFARIE